jgi:hypothetical protein
MRDCWRISQFRAASFNANTHSLSSDELDIPVPGRDAERADCTDIRTDDGARAAAAAGCGPGPAPLCLRNSI